MGLVVWGGLLGLTALSATWFTADYVRVRKAKPVPVPVTVS